MQPDASVEPDAAAAESGEEQSPQVPVEKPEGTVPNIPLPTDVVNLQKADWKKGIVSPTVLKGTHVNQAAIVNGYLVVGGNEEFWFYDISDPMDPRELSAVKSPNARSR